MSDAAGRSTEERTEPRPLFRLSGSGRVWLFNGVLAGLASLVYLTVVHPLDALEAPVRFPWWALAVAFAFTEIFVVHLPLRREAHSFSLSDIPLVLGLFFVTPAGVVLAQLVGAAAALVIRRQSPMKLAFNLGHFCLEAALAVVIFHAIAGHDPIGPSGLAAAFVATLTTTLVGAMAVTIAISLAEGRFQLQTMTTGLGFGAVVSATDTCLALIAAEIIWRDPTVAWLLVVPAVLMFFAYRLYTSQRQKHQTLEALYESTRHIQRSLRVESTMGTLLAEARAMFRAEIAEVLLFPTFPEEGAVRTTLGPGPEATSAEVVLDPTEGVWARVASEGQAVLLARPLTTARLREHFGARGIRDAMVAPLLGDGGVVGTLMVANRLGDVSTFDDEDLRLLETLANHASVALENARLVGRLEDSLEHLTEMNRLKDDFVATVSHELRTPLTNIQGSIKTLLRLPLGEDDRTALLEAADRGGERLRNLIEDLLMASRIESREIRAVLTPVSLSKLAGQVIEEFGDRATGRLSLDAAPTPVVETDEGKVSQILSNLVDNALKYSDQDRPVRVRVVQEQGGVGIRVESHGEPIPADQQERIFERFVQADQSSTRSVEGAGLGLYICRMLGEAIGGRVWLERSDENATVFGLFVPATPPERALRDTDDAALPVTMKPPAPRAI